MKFLFPHEIISKLDTFVATLPVDLSDPETEPGELEQQLAVLEGVLPHIEARAGITPVSKGCARLTKKQERYLAHWVLQARKAAYRLLDKQPDTPLGFPATPRGVLSNLLFATWIDLTEGGKVHVEWEQLD
jgi:hypothetical protein